MNYRIILTLVTILLCCFVSHTIRVPEFELTDDNFDALVANNCENQDWIIIFLADWCQSCVAFKPEIQKFSIESPALKKVDNLRIGLVDVAKNPGLTSRFMVFHIPSVYHGKSNIWRILQHHRSCDNLTSYFLNEEWNETQPRASYLGPCSIFGSGLAYMGYLGGSMVKGHEYLRQNYPPWVMYLVFIILAILPILISILLLRSGTSSHKTTIKTKIKISSKNESSESSTSSDRIQEKKSNRRIE